jgi:glycosyltransferase involved in cell wall biosynthesis
LVLKYSLVTLAAERSIKGYKPQVIHAHDLLALPAAVKVAALVDAKVVYDSHELERHRNGQRWIARWISAHQERRHIKRADAIVTVCDSIARHLADCYHVDVPCVVMNAPNLIDMKQRTVTVRDDVGVPAAKPLAIYVGKATFSRGLEEVIEALGYCEEFHLVVVGPASAQMREELTDLACRRGVCARFSMLNSVPHDELISYIRTADIGVVPTQNACLSYQYSLPNKLFEMTFAGLPICISDLTEQRRFVGFTRNGIVMDETDPRDIARAMREVYARRDELKLNEDRFEATTEKYAWQAQEARLTELYRALIR